MALEIVGISVLNDNYIWLVHDAVSKETLVVDPAVADPVLHECARRGWSITQIWNTHWHPDHTGGNVELRAASSCTIVGPVAENDKIPSLDIFVGEGDHLEFGGTRAIVMEVPAHTLGHIAFHFPEHAVAFVGDTLFAMGCGRLFEGTADQMFANMKRLEALPDETRIYCAHEYTQLNGRYALTVEPENIALIERMKSVDAARARGEATVPTTIYLERATNPMMRAESVSEFANRRQARDSFSTIL
jgi:hydroxyacylglutathione hydrolase